MQLDFSVFGKPTLDRKPIFATNGVVATSHYLASQAGLVALRQGGNAVDAALAAALVLVVVEQVSCDVGGDLFALVWDGKSLHGLNGSGRAPAGLTAEVVRGRGETAMPLHGWLAVTVLGAPAAWYDLHRRFGRLPFATLFESAIGYAAEGFPISPTISWRWRKAAAVHAALHGPEYSSFDALLLADGQIPPIGAVWRNPELAWTLQRIATSDAQDVYTGETAEKIADFAAQTGGVLTLDDLREHRSTWVDPISTSYRGYDVWEIPPNGQGLAALLALNILEGFDLAALPRQSPESYHLQIEAMKLAFADAHRYIADPERAQIPITQLLAKEYASHRRALIRERALLPGPGEPLTGGTVYLCATDADGMMVSLIQSNYHSFGSHVVVPGTGISLQNRGAGFSLDPSHPNYLEPGKRPFHTIIPGFLTHAGEAIGPFGVMGGHMQPQGHVQMIVNTLDYGLDPQASLDAPRWYWEEQRQIQVEPGMAPVVEALSQRGHEVQVEDDLGFVGRGQIIWRLPSGVYIAGSEPRADGCALGY